MHTFPFSLQFDVMIASGPSELGIWSFVWRSEKTHI